MTHETDCTCITCTVINAPLYEWPDDIKKAAFKMVDLVPPDLLKYDPESPFEKFMRETYMSEQPQLTTKPLDELEIGQRFFFIVEGDPAENPCVYAGESPCGRWFAYWERRDVRVPGLVTSVWSIEETADGDEEVICE